MATPIQSSACQAPPQYEIIKIPDVREPGRDQLKQQCFDLRTAVFTHEQGFPLETEIDDADETATHFLLRLVPSLEPIGTIRAIRTGDDYKLGRLVVLKEYRKHRFGRALVLALHDWAIPVKAFYAKYGYRPEGDEFDEDGAPHQKMVAQLQIPSEPNRVALILTDKPESK